MPPRPPQASTTQPQTTPSHSHSSSHAGIHLGTPQPNSTSSASSSSSAAVAGVTSKPLRYCSEAEKQRNTELLDIEKLHPSRTLAESTRIRAISTLNVMARHEYSRFFVQPVDIKRFAEYPKHVPLPMDLSLIMARLQSSYYRSFEVRLSSFLVPCLCFPLDFERSP